MTHITSHPTRPFASRSEALKIHQVPAAKDNYTWIIEGREKCAFVVDGPDPQVVLDYVAKRDLSLVGILNTHTHPDHIGINAALLKKLPHLLVYGSANAPKPIPGLTHPLNEGDKFSLDDVEVEVWLTEGHLDGHISFLMEDLLFSGDVLFGAGVGYMFDGPADVFAQTLDRIAALPTDTVVCAAHEYTLDNLRFAYSLCPGCPRLRQRIVDVSKQRQAGRSTLPLTLGEELQTNPFLRRDDPVFVRALKAQTSFPLSTSAERFYAMRKLKDRKHYTSISDEALFSLRD